MKNTGIVRRVDRLGRIVTPKELRKVMNIKSKETSLEVFVDDKMIILQKYTRSCQICGELKENMIEVERKPYCAECVKKLYEQVNRILAG